MAYDPTQRCLTDGCDGPPFFGETASPGYCDSCHVRRCEVDAARASLRDVLNRLDAEVDDERRSDLLDEMYGFGDDWPELRDEVRSYR